MFNRKQKKSQKKHNTSETPQKGGKNAPGDQDIGNSLQPGVSPSSEHDGQCYVKACVVTPEHQRHWPDKWLGCQ